ARASPRLRPRRALDARALRPPRTRRRRGGARRSPEGAHVGNGRCGDGEAGRDRGEGRAADDPRGDEDGAHDRGAGRRDREGRQLRRRRPREGRRRSRRPRRRLTQASPDATIAAWPDAPASPDYALVWKPPAELFIKARPTRAIFNLGAGVDALLTV